MNNAIPTPQELNQIDLQTVISALGGRLAPGSKLAHHSQMWIIGADKFGVTKQENRTVWINNSSGKGGVGAVKLVEHVLAIDYFQARDFMMKLIGNDAGDKSLSYQAVELTSVEFRVESKSGTQATAEFDDSTWLRVRSYLITERFLDSVLIDRLYDNYKIGSDVRGNAIFRRENRGFFTRGTGKINGTQKPYRPAFGNASCGCFVVNGETPNSVAFVEAPIDAISLHQTYPSLTVIATGGSTVSICAAMRHADGIDEVFAAFDRDSAGERYATQLLAIRPDAERLYPPENYKDWNDWLKSFSRNMHRE